jgi:hypothetical protein
MTETIVEMNIHFVTNMPFAGPIVQIMQINSNVTTTFSGLSVLNPNPFVTRYVAQFYWSFDLRLDTLTLCGSQASFQISLTFSKLVVLVSYTARYFHFVRFRRRIDLLLLLVVILV